MANASQFLQEGQMLDYTPASAVTAGQVIQIDTGLSAFATNSIAASAQGAVCVEGVIRGPYVGGIGNYGDNVWWDANGTPYGGAADGAFTLNAAAGDWWVGTLARPTAAATTATCDIAINKVNPNLPAWPNKAHVTTAVDLTWAAATHNGKVIHVTADAKTVTMPVGVAGMEAIIVNDVSDGGALLTVAFNGNETLEGNLALIATKTALNTKLTQMRGDYLHIRCETAASLWVCLAKRGTWVTS